MALTSMRHMAPAAYGYDPLDVDTITVNQEYVKRLGERIKRLEGKLEQFSQIGNPGHVCPPCTLRHYPDNPDPRTHSPWTIYS